MNVPVITIDGPSGTGKGTVARMIAKALHWHLLDSGVLYRVLALAFQNMGSDIMSESILTNYARTLDVKFLDTDNELRVYLNGEDVTDALRTESCANLASKVSAYRDVREALLSRQRAFSQLPGLVTDGRDMGTIVFPHAFLKFFLDASVEERAKRRTKQLQGRGINATLARVLDDLRVRDDRDRNRSFAPLKPAQDAILVDTTDLTVEEVYQVLMKEVNIRLSKRQVK